MNGGLTRSDCNVPGNMTKLNACRMSASYDAAGDGGTGSSLATYVLCLGLSPLPLTRNKTGRKVSDGLSIRA